MPADPWGGVSNRIKDIQESAGIPQVFYRLPMVLPSHSVPTDEIAPKWFLLYGKKDLYEFSSILKDLEPALMYVAKITCMC